jgi:hypothetical protein
MPSPKGGYQLNGKRVPSVTTILGRYKDSYHITDWAWRCGKKGLDYNVESHRAAKAGTLAHYKIECHYNKVEPDPAEFSNMPTEVLKWADTAFLSFLEWDKVHSPTISQMEIPMIDDFFVVGGTLDAVGTINGIHTLLDWKTSNRTYPDHIIQASVYADMYERQSGQTIEHVIICRFDKSKILYEETKISSQVRKEACEVFELMSKLYRTQKEYKL